jgi:hypothetical protein
VGEASDAGAWVIARGRAGDAVAPVEAIIIASIQPRISILFKDINTIDN